MAAASSSLDARTSSPIHEPSLPQPPPPKEAWIYIKETINEANERLVNQVIRKPTRIHRFPHHLRGIGGADGRYIVPSVVAIGPYHRGLPHLQAMEKVKLAAAHSFCRDLGPDAVKKVYEKIVSVSWDARRSYTIDDNTSLMATQCNTEFAFMMFLDGCFLLQFLTKNNEPPMAGYTMSSGHCIMKDIFLLENQIPWLVLEALMEFRPDIDLVDSVRGRTLDMTRLYLSEKKDKKATLFQRFLQNFLMKCRHTPEEQTRENEIWNRDSKMQHLLGLLRSIMTNDMPSQKRGSDQTRRSYEYLAQIGVKLTAGRARCFADVKFKKKSACGELSLSPLFLNDIAASFLVNLAALEAVEATNAPSLESDVYVVTSYLAVMDMFMDREEDVQQLRAKGVLHSHFSNEETLAFFKGLRQNLPSGNNYYAIIEEIHDYVETRAVWIAIYRFFYNNNKLIIAILSIAGVLIGIFKALYSLKKP